MQTRRYFIECNIESKNSEIDKGTARRNNEYILTHIYPGIYRWSQGLLFHQAMVDCARAAILLPLGSSILNCQPVNKCSLVETAFLLLVTVSTVNMLTTVLNDSPVFPESDEEADLAAPLLMDSPQVKIIAHTFYLWLPFAWLS